MEGRPVWCYGTGSFRQLGRPVPFQVFTFASEWESCYFGDLEPAVSSSGSYASKVFNGLNKTAALATCHEVQAKCIVDRPLLPAALPSAEGRGGRSWKIAGARGAEVKIRKCCGGVGRELAATASGTALRQLPAKDRARGCIASNGKSRKALGLHSPSTLHVPLG